VRDVREKKSESKQASSMFADEERSTPAMSASGAGSCASADTSAPYPSSNLLAHLFLFRTPIVVVETRDEDGCCRVLTPRRRKLRRYQYFRGHGAHPPHVPERSDHPRAKIARRDTSILRWKSCVNSTPVQLRSAFARRFLSYAPTCSYDLSLAAPQQKSDLTVRRLMISIATMRHYCKFVLCRTSLKP
jgi:hypothetical protein